MEPGKFTPSRTRGSKSVTLPFIGNDPRVKGFRWRRHEIDGMVGTELRSHLREVYDRLDAEVNHSAGLLSELAYAKKCFEHLDGIEDN